MSGQGYIKFLKREDCQNVYARLSEFDSSVVMTDRYGTTRRIKVKKSWAEAIIPGAPNHLRDLSFTGEHFRYVVPMHPLGAHYFLDGHNEFKGESLNLPWLWCERNKEQQLRQDINQVYDTALIRPNSYQLYKDQIAGDERYYRCRID